MGQPALVLKICIIISAIMAQHFVTTRLKLLKSQILQMKQ
jgi:hypothetical protein